MSSGDEGKLDPAEVAALYLEHGDELRRFLLGVIRDPQLVNDALQVAFTKLVERGHGTRSESRKAWLFRVAYNEALAVRRREAVGDRVFRRVAWSAEPAERSPEERLIRFETVEAVRAAMAKLPAAQLQVVRMRIYEEKTFAEIAEELQIPLGTALARMRAALIKLRSGFEKDGWESDGYDNA